MLSRFRGLAQTVLGVLALCSGAFSAAETARADPRPASPRAGLPAIADPEKQALATFETHCARCHEASRRGSESKPSRLDNILSLDALAHDPTYVIAGRPDASRLYQRLLGRHRPGNVFTHAGSDGPSADEIDAIRGWIASLPPKGESCKSRRAVSEAEAVRDMKQWLAGPASLDTRFVSLVHLYNGCVSAELLAVHRRTVEDLLKRLGRGDVPPATHTVGEASAILAFGLADLGLKADEWQQLTKGAPESVGGAIPGDWLAASLLATEGANVTIDGELRERVERLSNHWQQRDIDLFGAAGEMGLSPGELTRRLLEVDGEAEVTARRLVQNPVPRGDWERLAAWLKGERRPQRHLWASETSIDLALWSEKPAYNQGDLLTLNVVAGKACHLTLVGIDPSGGATVLFPNDLEPDNLIAPRVTVRVPSPNAGYQLRLDEAGEETIVAVCQRTARNLEGVSFDYEKQRFAVLGDWRGFLRSAASDEAQIRQAAKNREQRQARRRGNGASEALEAAAIDPLGPDVEGRAAITIPVEGKAKGTARETARETE